MHVDLDLYRSNGLESEGQRRCVTGHRSTEVGVHTSCAEVACGSEISATPMPCWSRASVQAQAVATQTWSGKQDEACCHCATHAAHHQTHHHQLMLAMVRPTISRRRLRLYGAAAVAAAGALAVAAAGSAAVGASSLAPEPRSYASHDYYALQLDPRARDEPGAAERAARQLGVELVERVGELPDHWLVRNLKHTSHKRSEADVEGEHDDPILRRWRQLPLDTKRHAPPTPMIRNVEKQVPRQRAKRDKIYSLWDTPELYSDPQPRRGWDDNTVSDALPWRRHLPAPRGAVPDPRDDPDFSFFTKGNDSVLLPRLPPSETIVTSMERQFLIHDPLFPKQWHLANDRIQGNDLNLSGVWSQGITGRGVRVALIDDGLDMHSDDLKDNFFAEGSYDFNDHVPLPEPRLYDDTHGTRCAGEIAAAKNEACGVGVAYDAQVAGLRILSGPISDADEASALNYRFHDNHVYSCSWGPPDDGRSMDAPRGLIAQAILNGVQRGRQGKGSVYVFAGGNGGGSDDQCNFDGYTNSIYSLTIAAIDRNGQHPYYSEMCSAILGSSWSSGSGDHIHTTDASNLKTHQQRCTSGHGGTSAAAPLVAGIVALGLSVRPELTWRDVQHVAIKSAAVINPKDADWQTTQAGRPYNHKYGFGVIDSWQFIENARDHQLVKPQAWLASTEQEIAPTSTLIQEGGVSSSLQITPEMMLEANLATIEHITVKVWVTHERRGDLQVELTSPHGTKSVLARPRRYDENRDGLPGWGFMTLKHWGEDAVGDWTVSVFDQANPLRTGNFWKWQITLWGESIDPAKATDWKFPDETEEAKGQLPNPNGSAVGDPAATPSIEPTASEASKQHPKPTEHLPSDHAAQPGETDINFTQPSSGADRPEADTGYLARLRGNGPWVWVGAGVALAFLVGLGVYFSLWVRRQRRRNRGTGYEFVPDEEEDVMMGTLDGGRARAKELYDAFGDDALSDDEGGEEDRAALLQATTDVYQDDPHQPQFALHDGDISDDEEASARPPANQTSVVFDANLDQAQN